MAITKIGFDEVCKKYPKLEEFGKWPELEIHKIADKGNYVFYRTVCKSARFDWEILKSSIDAISFVNIDKYKEDKVTPFLVLGTWLYITTNFGKNIDKSKNIWFNNVTKGGISFLTKLLHYKKKDFTERIIKNVSVKKNESGEDTWTFSLSFEEFESRIAKVWEAKI